MEKQIGEIQTLISDHKKLETMIRAAEGLLKTSCDLSVRNASGCSLTLPREIANTVVLLQKTRMESRLKILENKILQMHGCLDGNDL